MSLATLELYRHTCRRCPHGQQKCAGPCRCDRTGKDIREHQKAGDCPLFPPPVPDDQSPPIPKPAPPMIRAVPVERWPFVVRVLAARKTEGEAGVGDTAKRLLAKMGAESLAWLYEKATGRPCGCGDRQGRLNLLFPY